MSIENALDHNVVQLINSELNDFIRDKTKNLTDEKLMLYIRLHIKEELDSKVGYEVPWEILIGYMNAYVPNAIFQYKLKVKSEVDWDYDTDSFSKNLNQA